MRVCTGRLMPTASPPGGNRQSPRTREHPVGLLCCFSVPAGHERAGPTCGCQKLWSAMVPHSWPGDRRTPNVSSGRFSPKVNQYLVKPKFRGLNCSGCAHVK